MFYPIFFIYFLLVLAKGTLCLFLKNICWKRLLAKARSDECFLSVDNFEEVANKILNVERQTKNDCYICDEIHGAPG